ncbi:hypothetical protein RhiTH_009924 [Rhizoctonia solani]
MTKLRLKSREAIIPKFQEWVASINRQGFLRRCYTQNFDGIQLQTDGALSGKVYELHGSNQRLRCHTCSQISLRPIEDFDHMLGELGLVQCDHCKEIAKAALALNKRARPIGYLVPDIIFNQQVQDISWENKGWDLKFDTEVDLFIIAGTTLKTDGTYKLVKKMAQNTQRYGGIVVYLDQGIPCKKISSLIDVHFCLEADLFPCCFNENKTKDLFLKISPSLRTTEDYKFMRFFDTITTITPFDHNRHLSTGSSSKNHLAKPTLKPYNNHKILIFHTPQNVKVLNEYRQALVEILNRRGHRVELISILIGSFDNIPCMDTGGFHILCVLLTSSVVITNAVPAGQDMEVAEMIHFMRRIIPAGSDVLSLEAVVFGCYDAFSHLALAQRLEMELQR